MKIVHAFGLRYAPAWAGVGEGIAVEAEVLMARCLSCGCWMQREHGVAWPSCERCRGGIRARSGVPR